MFSPSPSASNVALDQAPSVGRTGLRDLQGGRAAVVSPSDPWCSHGKGAKNALRRAASRRDHRYSDLARSGTRAESMIFLRSLVFLIRRISSPRLVRIVALPLSLFAAAGALSSHLRLVRAP